jgi:Ser/Thr protein kinase RdoA (MazF antagonist)
VLTDHAAQIADCFGLGARVQAMSVAARGQQGRVWRLDTEVGTWAVKELLVRQREEDAAVDVAYQEVVLAAGTVVMPRPVRSENGHVLLELAGHQVRAYGWVDLLPADYTFDPTVVGTALAAIHRIRRTVSGPVHPWYTDPVGRARWTELGRQVEAVAAPFADAFATEIPYLVALEEFLEPSTELQICHRDLWADNMLPTPAGELCVIDWENCGAGTPGHEIPMSLFDFGQGDQRRVALLYQAYVDSGGPGRVTGRGSFSMVIAQFGHFWESAVRGYLAADAGGEDQARSLDRVAELLRTPLRVEHIDEVLDTVTQG